MLLTCAVLAGGLGRRFGGDKLTAPLGQRRVIDHTVAALQGMAGRILLVGAGVGLDGPPGTLFIADAEPAVAGASESAGPLAGIVAALESATTPLVAIVAADMPLASASVLASLAAGWTGEPAVLPVVGGRPEPLHAIYATVHRRAFRAAFDKGARSPLSVARELGAQFVDVDGDGWELDVDTPADLRLVQHRLGCRPGRRGPRAPGSAQG